MLRKSVWLLSAALVAVPTQVLAQEPTVPPPTTPDTTQTNATPTEDAGADEAAVDNAALEQQPVDSNDIVITATRQIGRAHV